MPLANLPMTLAVHGATSSSAMPIGDRDVLDVGVHARAPLRRDHRTPGDRLEGHRPDEPRRRARHHRHDVVAALLQPAAHLDRLVGADAAGDAERDQGHGQLPVECRDEWQVPSCIGVGQDPCDLSSHLLDLAPQHFALRDGDLLVAGLARHRAGAAAAARACPAITTNSKRFSFGGLSHDCPLRDRRSWLRARLLGPLKRVDDRLGRRPHRLHPRPLRQHDGPQPLDGRRRARR